MKLKNSIKTIVTWLPSLLLTLFYVPNAYTKIVESDHSDKIITNNIFISFAGIILLIAVVMFLYHKTISIGTIILVLYMTFVTCIHIYKGKPYETVMLIGIATVFAAHLRKPTLFHKKNM